MNLYTNEIIELIKDLENTELENINKASLIMYEAMKKTCVRFVNFPNGTCLFPKRSYIESKEFSTLIVRVLKGSTEKGVHT